MRGTNVRKLLVQPRPIKGANYPKTFVVVYFYRLSIDFYKFLEPDSKKMDITIEQVLDGINNLDIDLYETGEDAYRE